MTNVKVFVHPNPDTGGGGGYSFQDILVSQNIAKISSFLREFTANGSYNNSFFLNGAHWQSGPLHVKIPRFENVFWNETF